MERISKEKINVVFATDAKYLNYLEITLKSLLAHNENLSVFVMNTGSIDIAWLNKLQPYFEKRNCSLQLVKIDNSFLADFNPHAHISPAGYLRFYIDSLFQYSSNPYWIYLDCDIVINDDITLPFKKYDFSSYALGAVSDVGVKTYSWLSDIHIGIKIILIQGCFILTQINYAKITLVFLMIYIN